MLYFVNIKGVREIHYIYVITNLINNKQYVGETSLTIEDRLKAHFQSAKYRLKYDLYKDMIEYGKSNFKIELLEEFESENRQQEIERESYWIEKLNTYNNGYNNIEKHGYTSIGYKFSDERKEEYSKKFSGENNPMYGKKLKDLMSEEQIALWKQHLSEARKGKKFTEEHKKNLSENSGKKKRCCAIINGERVEFDSITKLANFLNRNINTVSVAIKRGKTVNGVEVYYI